MECWCSSHCWPLGFVVSFSAFTTGLETLISIGHNWFVCSVLIVIACYYYDVAHVGFVPFRHSRHGDGDSGEDVLSVCLKMTVEWRMCLDLHGQLQPNPHPILWDPCCYRLLWFCVFIIFHHFMQILRPLANLRQACCHPQAVRASFINIHDRLVVLFPSPSGRHSVLAILCDVCQLLFSQ